MTHTHNPTVGQQLQIVSNSSPCIHKTTQSKHTTALKAGYGSLPYTTLPSLEQQTHFLSDKMLLLTTPSMR